MLHIGGEHDTRDDRVHSGFALARRRRAYLPESRSLVYFNPCFQRIVCGVQLYLCVLTSLGVAVLYGGFFIAACVVLSGWDGYRCGQEGVDQREAFVGTSVVMIVLTLASSCFVGAFVRHRDQRRSKLVSAVAVCTDVVVVAMMIWGLVLFVTRDAACENDYEFERPELFYFFHMTLLLWLLHFFFVILLINCWGRLRRTNQLGCIDVHYVADSPNGDGRGDRAMHADVSVEHGDNDDPTSDSVVRASGIVIDTADGADNGTAHLARSIHSHSHSPSASSSTAVHRRSGSGPLSHHSRLDVHSGYASRNSSSRSLFTAVHTSSNRHNDNGSFSDSDDYSYGSDDTRAMRHHATIFDEAMSVDVPDHIERNLAYRHVDGCAETMYYPPAHADDVYQLGPRCRAAWPDCPGCVVVTSGADLVDY